MTPLPEGERDVTATRLSTFRAWLNESSGGADPRRDTKLAGRLAGGAAVVTALLALFGISGGQLDRLLRNDAALALSASALLGVAIGLGILLTDSDRTYSRWQALGAIACLIGVAGLLMVAAKLRDLEHSSLARAFTVAALGVALIAVILLLKDVSGRSFILILAVVLFFSGCGLLSWLSVSTKSAKERPRISGKIVADGQGFLVQARVRAQGLTNRELVVVSIEGLNNATALAYGSTGRSYGPLPFVPKNRLRNGDFYQPLLFTRSGPDADGSINLPVQIPVSSGLYQRVRIAARIGSEHDLRILEREQKLVLAVRKLKAQRERTDNALDRARLGRAVKKAKARLDLFRDNHAGELNDPARCNETARERACLVFTLPAAPGRPALGVIAKGPKTALVTVEARSMNVDDLIGLTVTVGGRTTLRSLIAPSGDGRVDVRHQFRVNRPARVCAHASLITASFAKPPTPLAPAPADVCGRPKDPTTTASGMLRMDP